MKILILIKHTCSFSIWIHYVKGDRWFWDHLTDILRPMRWNGASNLACNVGHVNVLWLCNITDTYTNIRFLIRKLDILVCKKEIPIKIVGKKNNKLYNFSPPAWWCPLTWTKDVNLPTCRDVTWASQTSCSVSTSLATSPWYIYIMYISLKQ